jgi:hypothetical protein
MNYLIILILLLILFILINYFLNTEYFDSTDGIVDLDTYPVNVNYEDLCSRSYTPWAIAKRQLQRKRNRRKKIINKIITNIQGEVIGEEQIYLENCAGYNEKCLLDEKGENTCCGNLKCVRLSKDYGYKVCSYQDDACGHNKISFTILNKLFTLNILEKILDDKWWYTFLQTKKNKYKNNNEISEEQEEEQGLTSFIPDYSNDELNELRNKIKEKTNDLCKGKNLDGYLFKSFVKSELQTMLIENEIFAGLIFGVSKSAKGSSMASSPTNNLFSSQNNNNIRNCNISKNNRI